ncbi:MAG: zinc ribbon domain-containing protein [bacterium]
MNPQLQLLIDLQHLDIEISMLNKKIAEIPLQIEALQKEEDNQKLEFERRLQAAGDIEKEKRKKEHELEARESGLAKLKNQLLAIKTNREYQALLHEIEEAKTDISHLEEEVLSLIEDGESAREEIKEIRAELRESEERIEGQKRDREHDLEMLLQQRQDLQAERVAVQQQISQELIKKYNKLKEYRNGIAVVQVIDGSCQGCFMSLMPQLFQEVKQNADIYYCPHCHRIVYYKVQ